MKGVTFDLGKNEISEFETESEPDLDFGAQCYTVSSSDGEDIHDAASDDWIEPTHKQEFNCRELELLQKAVDAEKERVGNLSKRVRDSLTVDKMVKLHQQFGHPSDQKLQYLLEWNCC